MSFSGVMETDMKVVEEDGESDYEKENGEQLNEEGEN